MDNVLNHAETPIGGVVQASTQAEGKYVEFVVADYGVGIPKSLKVRDHRKALERAIQEGVTRNSETNQGNGLFGTFEVARVSNGEFQLQSGRASLVAKPSREIKIYRTEGRVYPGTAVLVRIKCSEPDVLEKALQFGGKQHEPAFDYLERHSIDEDGVRIVLNMKEETTSFGSRDAAKPVYQKILNLLGEGGAEVVEINFDGVYVVTSSFADEVFGKLFAEMGPLSFMQKIRFHNTDSTIRGLIDRAIVQRSRI